MKKKAQPGPIIEQRRFEFDGHCFYVPLKIAINVRLDNTSRAKLGKRRAHGKRRGKNHELKRCRPTNYWSFPPTPEWVKRGISRKEFEERQKAHEEWLRNIPPVVLRAVHPGLVSLNESSGMNLFNVGDVSDRNAVLRAMLICAPKTIYYSNSSGSTPTSADTPSM